MLRCLPSDDDVVADALRSSLLQQIEEGFRTWSDALSIQHGYVLVFGSVRLTVQLVDADVDILCAAAGDDEKYRDAFFATFPLVLRETLQPDQMHYVANAVVPVLKLTWKGVCADIAFAGVPGLVQASDIDDEAVVSLSHEKAQRSIAGVRNGEAVHRSVPNHAVFWAATRFIKHWALTRGVYGTVYGYLGGGALAIMVARECQQHPFRMPAFVVGAVFQKYASLTRRLLSWEEQGASDSDPRAIISVCDSASHAYTPATFERLLVINPVPHHTNTSRNVVGPQLRHLHEELDRAVKLLENDLADSTWQMLLEPADFFSGADQFLEVVVAGLDNTVFRTWSGYVGSRLRGFPAVLESEWDFLRVALYPRELHPPADWVAANLPYDGFEGSDESDAVEWIWAQGREHKQSREQRPSRDTPSPPPVSLKAEAGTPRVGVYYLRLAFAEAEGGGGSVPFDALTRKLQCLVKEPCEAGAVGPYARLVAAADVPAWVREAACYRPAAPAEGTASSPSRPPSTAPPSPDPSARAACRGTPPAAIDNVPVAVAVARGRPAPDASRRIFAPAATPDDPQTRAAQSLTPGADRHVFDQAAPPNEVPQGGADWRIFPPAATPDELQTRAAQSPPPDDQAAPLNEVPQAAQVPPPGAESRFFAAAGPTDDLQTRAGPPGANRHIVDQAAPPNEVSQAAQAPPPGDARRFFAAAGPTDGLQNRTGQSLPSDEPPQAAQAPPPGADCRSFAAAGPTDDLQTRAARSLPTDELQTRADRSPPPGADCRFFAAAGRTDDLQTRAARSLPSDEPPQAAPVPQPGRPAARSRAVLPAVERVVVPPKQRAARRGILDEWERRPPAPLRAAAAVDPQKPSAPAAGAPGAAAPPLPGTPAEQKPRAAAKRGGGGVNEWIVHGPAPAPAHPPAGRGGRFEFPVLAVEGFRFRDGPAPAEREPGEAAAAVDFLSNIPPPATLVGTKRKAASLTPDAAAPPAEPAQQQQQQQPPEPKKKKKKKAQGPMVCSATPRLHPRPLTAAPAAAAAGEAEKPSKRALKRAKRAALEAAGAPPPPSSTPKSWLAAGRGPPPAPKAEGMREDPKQEDGERLSTPFGYSQQQMQPFAPPAPAPAHVSVAQKGEGRREGRGQEDSPSGYGQSLVQPFTPPSPLAPAHVPVAAKGEGRRGGRGQEDGESLSTPSGYGQSLVQPFTPPSPLAPAHVPVAAKGEGRRGGRGQEDGESLSTPSGYGQPQVQPFEPPSPLAAARGEGRREGRGQEDGESLSTPSGYRQPQVQPFEPPTPLAIVPPPVPVHVPTPTPGDRWRAPDPDRTLAPAAVAPPAFSTPLPAASFTPSPLPDSAQPATPQVEAPPPTLPEFPKLDPKPKRPARYRFVGPEI
ncbi:Nuclear poly(A) polymerase 4 [Diplonema papillatum]|nr:Nuclear poly(A) polymerase 4 [Diplonema papillatum]